MLTPVRECVRSSWWVTDLDVQFDVQVYSGLCITIPPRSLKRKLQDVDVAIPQQPKVGVLFIETHVELTP